MNLVTLLGRVGREPESRSSQQGTQVVNLSLATNKKIKGEDKTSWHRLVAFSKTAEIIEKYVKKGDQLGVEGELNYGNYDKDGTTVYTTDIIVNRIHFVSGGQGGGNLPQNQRSQAGNALAQEQSQDNEPYNPPAGSQGSPPDDDIPF